MTGLTDRREEAAADGESRFLTRNRLEAFSDGVFAILITIMVLGLRMPNHPTWTAFSKANVVGTLLLYAFSFVFLGIYWSNHHHMMSLVDRVTGGMLWANLFLLFWLSLIPFLTRWAGEPPLSSAPIVAYAIVALMSGAGYTILQRAIIRSQGERSALKAAVGDDLKGKASLVAYLLSIPLALVTPWLAIAVFCLVAGMWLVPDRRIERSMTNRDTVGMS